MAHPPRLAERLLRAVLQADDAEAIGGDLDESFHGAVPRIGARAARRWYWQQVLSIAVARMGARRSETQVAAPRGGFMTGLKQDAAYAVRSLRKQPGFAAMAVLMLAVGIGATLAMFSLAHAVLYKPLPFADPDRLELVHLLAPDRESPGVIRKMIWSWPKYRMLREHQQVFESLALLMNWSWNVTGLSGPERIAGEAVEASYFEVLGVTARVGRVFAPEETGPGATPLVLLGHGFWVRSFGADPSIVGRALTLNGVPHTVVGILPPGFRGLTGQADMWVPVMTVGADDYDQPWSHSYTVVGRRRPGVSPQTSDAAMQVIGAQIDRQYADKFVKGAWSATSVPLDGERVHALIRRSILLLLAAVASVLLIVCINLANLTLTRGLAREREVAIRLALGASRLRVVRQLMTESALLAMAGAAAGLVVAYVTVSAGAALMPDLRMVLPSGQTAGLTRVGLSRLGLDVTILLFTVGIAAVAALLFGLGPAWRASGYALTTTMKAGAAGALSAGARGLALRNVLIVAEVALALVLLTAGGLMLKSVSRLQAAELGFNPASLLTFRVALPSPQYNPAKGIQFFDALLARLAGRADVESAGFGSCAPVSGGCNRTLAEFPDRPPAAAGTEPLTGVLWVSPDYFETLSVRLVRGRFFTPQDRVGQPKVVIVDETAASRFWNGEDPIGRRIALGQGGFRDGAEVVGVVANVRYGDVDGSMEPSVHLPLLQSARTFGLVYIKSRVSNESIVSAVRAEVQALDPTLPITDIKLMEERFAEATWHTRTSAWVLGIFAALALTLAALGIYGVMAQGVEQRTREIGVRLALGAERSHIFRLIVGQVFGIALAGIALGVMLAIPATRLLTALLYQVEPGDPFVIATLSMLLLAVAMLAGYIPARRATRVDPLNTLRAE